MARKRNRVKSQHIRFARSLKYEQPESFFEGKTAKELIELAECEIDRLNVRIAQRKIIKPTTTLPFTLWLGKNVPSYDDVSKAALLWHEIPHIHQWHDPSNHFLFRYPARRWQWAFETQGYRQQCRVIRALRGDKAARKFAYWVPGRMQKAPYTMRRLDARHVRKITLQAFEAGLPGLRLI